MVDPLDYTGEAGDRSCWFGQYGPYLYNELPPDPDLYGDGEELTGMRVPQGFIDDPPTIDNHIATKEYVDDMASPILLSEIGAGRRMVQNHEATFDHVSTATGLTGVISDLAINREEGRRSQQAHEAAFDHNSIASVVAELAEVVSDLTINREGGRRFQQAYESQVSRIDILATQVFS